MKTYSAVVMAHPSRRDDAERLAKQVGGFAHYDVGGWGPGENFMRCLQAGLEDGGAVVWVTQDDMIPCQNIRHFADEVARAVHEHSVPIFMLAHNHVADTWPFGLLRVSASDFVYTWSLMIHRRAAESILDDWRRGLFVEESRIPRKPEWFHDDGWLTRWMKARAVVVYARHAWLQHGKPQQSLLAHTYRDGRNVCRGFVGETYDAVKDLIDVLVGLASVRGAVRRKWS
jgi:hypothetical protein